MNHSRGKGLLICFSGLDGTGKTVHAMKLMRFLRVENHSCKCVHGRWDPSLSYPFLAFLRLMGITRKVQKGNSQYFERSLDRSTPLSLLWQFFVWIDETVATFFKVTLPLKMGMTVICDRYVYDLVVDVAADLESESVMWKIPLKLAFKTTPNPDIAFLMVAPESCAYDRKDDTPNMKYLRIRKHLIQDLAKHFPFIIVDSTLPMPENQESVLEKVREVIGRSKGRPLAKGI